MKYNTHSHWRDSARIPKMFFIDAYAFIPVVLWLFHPRLWTFTAAIFVIILMLILRRFGIDLIILLRLVREFIAGDKKLRINR
ncbi:MULTISPECIES: IcmT/TraK family protein [Cysteiniphilum]|uniref:IcmT/TraK family protein n=1 Tax=Cysteiniphilum TaxID=2056696 RepID=UPI00177DC5A5|nr:MULTISPECIES: IcmT/TraK family protein [Cysteiniphilum]